MGRCGKSKNGRKNGGRIVRRRFDIGLVRRTAKTSPEKCVWIGGLKKREGRKDANLNKALQTWINKLCGESGCKFVDIGPKGSGGAVFGSEEEASAAMAKLKGKIFQGCKLQSDVYVKGWTDDLYDLQASELLCKNDADDKDNDKHDADGEDMALLRYPVRKSYRDLSQLLARVLRHTASRWDLQLSEDGYALISDVLELQPFVRQGATSNDIAYVVGNRGNRKDKKQRFSIRQGARGAEVRAIQGHSDPAVDGMQIAETISVEKLPAVLLHGTFLQKLPEILREGLRPMTRHHIHLFMQDTGVVRRKAEVYIHVSVKLAVAAGVVFFQTQNGTVLTPGNARGVLPSSCFLRCTRADDGSPVDITANAIAWRDLPFPSHGHSARTWNRSNAPWNRAPYRAH